MYENHNFGAKIGSEELDDTFIRYDILLHIMFDSV